MASIKAPAGGIVSHVNNQFYNGGEFIPDTGLYCGKGRNRVSLAQFADLAAKFAAEGKTLRYSEQLDRFQVVLSTGNVFYSSKSLKTLAVFVS